MPPTAAHLRFARLTAEIEALRAALAHWQRQVDLHRQAYARSVGPLWRRLDAARRASALALDRLLDEPGWNRAERTALHELLAGRIAELRRDRGADDSDGEESDARAAEWLALLQRQADASAPAAKRGKRRMPGTQHASDAVTADPVPEFDHEAELDRQRDRREADARARTASRRARRAATTAPSDDAAAAQPAAQSLRDVFRKLASVLHPDREIDPARRGIKTALMQQANRAHADKDLLALLALQSEVAPADPTRAAMASAQQLVQYTRALETQAAGLTTAIARIEADFRAEVGLPAGRGLNPDRLVAYARQDAQQLRDALAAHVHEMRLFGDATAVRSWLKQRLRESRRAVAPGQDDDATR